MNTDVERYLGLKEQILRHSPQTKILVVTKTQGEQRIRDFLQALPAGERPPLGENYADELAMKALALEDLGPQWHFIGPPQMRGLKKIAPFVKCVHSVTRLKEVEFLESHKIPYFIQVNISGESSKSGISQDGLTQFLSEQTRKQPLSDFCWGFMAMAAPVDSVGQDSVTRSFGRLEELRDQHLPGRGLCIGMSDDFMMALKFAPRFVRLGSSIFGPRTS
jgi:uncharacterized pyridoxal phosphate-containing UPF0001 family protein